MGSGSGSRSKAPSLDGTILSSSNSHPLGLSLLLQGVRIPTFGCFDVVQTETLVGNKTVILQRPMFHLARNIGEGQNLENKDDLTGKAEDLTLQTWDGAGYHTTFLRASPGKHLWPNPGEVHPPVIFQGIRSWSL